MVETGVLDKKTTDMPQVTDEIDHIQLYRVHVAISEIRNRNFGGVFSKKHLFTQGLNNTQENDSTINMSF